MFQPKHFSGMVPFVATPLKVLEIEENLLRNYEEKPLLEAMPRKGLYPIFLYRPVKRLSVKSSNFILKQCK